MSDRAPLEGTRVLDFSSVGPASRCSRILAHYGAEVVKVAPPPRKGALQIQPPFYAYSANRGLKKVMIDLKAEGHLDAESSDDILKAVAARLMSKQPDYRCHHCGFSGHTHHWQCPSCRNWSTTKKIHGVLVE